MTLVFAEEFHREGFVGFEKVGFVGMEREGFRVEQGRLEVEEERHWRLEERCERGAQSDIFVTVAQFSRVARD